MDKYSVLTSMGSFEVYLNTENLKKDSSNNYYYPKESFKITQDGLTIIKGLYIGLPSKIIKSNDQLWLIIELEDDFYGSPEYLLTK